MSWTSAYNATFTKPVVRQLMAFIQRDQRDALDFVGGAGVLPDFVTYQLSPMAIPQFPGVVVTPAETIFDQDAVGSRHSSNPIVCAVAVANQDQDVLAELIQDYVCALDAIFSTVPLSDFYSSWDLLLRILGSNAIPTTALESGSVKELFVVRHQYGQIRQRANGFVCSATLELKIDREET